MDGPIGIRVRTTDGDPVLAAQIAARFERRDFGPMDIVVGRWADSIGNAPVVVVGPDDPAHMIECLEGGATGYVVADQSLQAITSAVESVGLGRAVVPDHLLGDLLKHVVERRRRASASVAALDGLTPREVEVFEVAARGADKKQIGELLAISPETARTHIANIFKKLAINSRSELIALAASLGYEVSPLESKEFS